jgi:hypothetical protein
MLSKNQKGLTGRINALHRNSRLPFSLLMYFSILFPFWFAHRSPHPARLWVSLIR